METRYYIISSADEGHFQHLSTGNAPTITTNWLAFDHNNRRACVEVKVDDEASFATYEAFYGSRATVTETGDLPSPELWSPTIGERESDEVDTDPQKHIVRYARLVQRLSNLV